MTADDGDLIDNIGDDEIVVAIANVAPTVVLSGPATADEGQTKTYTYTATDPGADTLVITESCGANGVRTDTPAVNSFDCTFPDGPANSTVKVTADDGDLIDNIGDDEIVVVHRQRRPDRRPLGPGHGRRGPDQDLHLHGDRSGGRHPGDDRRAAAPTASGPTPAAVNSFDCTFPDGPANSTVKVTADDGDLIDNIGDDEIVVAIANMKPEVTFAAIAVDPVTGVISSTMSYSDVGVNDRRPRPSSIG